MNVLITVRWQAVVKIFCMRGQSAVGMSRGGNLVRMDLGPQNVLDDDQGREQEGEPSARRGNMAGYCSSLP